MFTLDWWTILATEFKLWPDGPKLYALY